jgi:hypothetical protein
MTPVLWTNRSPGPIPGLVLPQQTLRNYLLKNSQKINEHRQWHLYLCLKTKSPVQKLKCPYLSQIFDKVSVYQNVVYKSLQGGRVEDTEKGHRGMGSFSSETRLLYYWNFLIQTKCCLLQAFLPTTLINQQIQRLRFKKTESPNSIL